MISTKEKFLKLILFGGVLVSFALATIYFFAKDQFRDAVQISSEAGNVALTRVFVNETWSGINPLLPPPGASPEDVRNNPNIPRIDEQIRRFTLSTDVVKIKLYNMKGLTIYSSEKSQIGEDKATNPGFNLAARGGIVSELTTRGKFSTFDAEIYNRNLVSTYVPIREAYQVVAVAEIYADRTGSMKVTEQLLTRFLILLISVSLILFVGVFLLLYRISRANKPKSSEFSDDTEGMLLDSERDQVNHPVNTLCTTKSSFCTAKFGTLIQSLIFANELRRPGNDSSRTLELLSQISGPTRERALRCRTLIQIEQERYRSRTVALSLDEIKRQLNSYAEYFQIAHRPQVDFHMSTGLPDTFTQDQELLLHYLKTIVEYAAVHYSSPKIRLQFFWDTDKLRLESILSGSKIEADFDQTHSSSVFQIQLDVIGKAIGNEYKAVFSATGGVASLTLEKIETTVPPLSDLSLDYVLVLGGNNHNADLLRAALQTLGLQSIYLGEVSDIETFVPPKPISVAIICLENNNTAQAESMLSIVKSRGWTSDKRTFLARDIFETDILPKGEYRLLDQPIDLVDLREILAASDES